MNLNFLKNIDFPKMNWDNLKEVAFLVIGVMIVITMWAHDKDIDRNHKTSLESRSEDCRLQLGLGIPLSKNCLGSEMRPYFNPEEEITTAAFRAACHTMRQNNLPLQEGCPDE